MSIKASRGGRTVRLLLKGAMAQGNGNGSLRRAVAQGLRAGASRIEIDASHVRFLDAAGLGELVACRAMAEDAGAEFRLDGVRGKTLELIAMTGLDKVLIRRPRSKGVHRLTFRVA